MRQRLQLQKGAKSCSFLTGRAVATAASAVQVLLFVLMLSISF
jgi:hypothetical protein